MAAVYRRTRYFLLSRGGGKTLEGADGIRWRVQSGNALDMHLVTNDGIYSSFLPDLLTRFGDPTSVAIDVGANAGYWTLPMARRFGSVYAFEADPEMFQKLHTNVSLNSDICDHITLMNCAVSDVVGEAVFSIRRSVDGDSLLNTGLSNLVPEGLSEAGIRVSTVTLDSVFCDAEGVVGFIKVDVEGAEELVLAGGARVIALHHPTIFWEATTTVDAQLNRNNVRNCLNILTANGYQHVAILSTGRAVVLGGYSDLVDIGVDVDILSSWSGVAAT